MEYPIACINEKTPINDNGIVIMGIIVARTEPKNKKIIAITMTAASAMVFNTSYKDARINVVASNTTALFKLGGNPFSKIGNCFFTCVMTVSGLASGVAFTAINTAFCLLK